MENNQEPEQKTINDYLDIVRRRKWSIVLPAMIVFFLAAIAVFVLPRTYRSTSTILIEEREIPPEFVIATVTGYAEQRLQAINQRIMSTQRLLDIINRFNLYSDERSRKTVEEVVEKMRKDIKLSQISADVVDRRTGRPGQATIAFTLSYDGKRPDTVQQVANVLASLFLEENLKTREQQAAGASKFLNDEAKEVQKKLIEQDARIAGFKAKNINALPELLQLNLQSLDRIELELDRLNDQLRTLKEKEEYLQSQLASIPTDAANQDRTLLKELKARLVQLQSRFSDKYPDVIKTKAEIAELEKRVATISKDENTQKKPLLTDQPDNPAYVTLAAQLASTQSEIDSIKRQIGEVRKKREDYRARSEAGPRVEEAYRQLMTERNNAQAKYDDLTKKLMEARVSQGLEKEQMGERFTLIDPARLPEKPVKPNIPAVLLIGAFLGIGAGIGTASLREFADQSLRTSTELSLVTSIPVLASIPVIVTEKDKREQTRKRYMIITGTVIGIIVLVLAVHLFVANLEVLWVRAIRKLPM